MVFLANQKVSLSIASPLAKIEESPTTAALLVEPPPETGKYTVTGRVLTLKLESAIGSHTETYTLSADAKTLTGEAGAVLTLKTEISLASKQFCRMVSTGGAFGQPSEDREHCIKFIDEKKVSDNGSTFFGSHPEHGTYVVKATVITLTLTSENRSSHQETYTLSADGKSIVGEAGAVLTLKN